MSGSSFSPIPLQVQGSASGTSGVVTRFQSALPVLGVDQPSRWFPPLVVIPSVPSPSSVPEEQFARSWPPPIDAIPVPGKSPASGKSPVLPEIVLAREDQEKLREVPDAADQTQKPVDPAPENPFKAAPEYTDEDLVEALTPMIGTAARSVVYATGKANVDGMLEPMLRATVRRALAEYSPASRPFQPPGFVDKTVWRLQALFSSRTFEDVLFEKTHRFQVEEVYLFDAASLALVSFASCDPARHTSTKRVDASAKRIALQIRNEDGEILRSFEQADGKNVISEVGDYMVLVALVRGQPNEMFMADLEFSLRRIEEHFRERFEQAGSALMHALQPFLEDCLLIQAPASAA